MHIEFNTLRLFRDSYRTIGLQKQCRCNHHTYLTLSVNIKCKSFVNLQSHFRDIRRQDHDRNKSLFLITDCLILLPLLRRKRFKAIA